MTVIDRCKKQLLENDYTEKLFDISKVKIGGFASIMLKIGSEEKSKSMIWKDILAGSKNWVIKPEAIEAIWELYDEVKMDIKGPINIVALSELVYMKK